VDGHGLAAGESVGGETVRKEKEWRIGENRPQFKSRHEIKNYPNQKANPGRPYL